MRLVVCVDEFLTATKVGERTEVEGWGWAVDVASRVEEKVDFNFFFTASKQFEVSSGGEKTRTAPDLGLTFRPCWITALFYQK